MSGTPEKADDRLLSVGERELVEATQPAARVGRSRAELQALGARLREARDRARGIARRQQREMRGKSEPRGTTLTRDNTGSLAKTELLVAALKRVTSALRRLNTPTQADMTRKAMAAKQAAQVEHHPDAGRTASKGLQPKVSKRPTVRMDPREIGQASQAGKKAQARRDQGSSG
jgi:hypothetical protein